MKVTRFICDNRYRIFKSFLVYFTFFCLGSATTLLGSSLLDLEISLNADFAKVSYLIPVRSAGHIVGSAFAGVIGQKFNRSLVLCICNLISGIFLGTAPNFKQFEYVACFLFIAGIAHGIADVLCNTLITDTWKDKCTNWLQALHMSWGIGSLITPVICRPFLIPEQDETQTTTNETLKDPSITTINMKPTADDVKAQYAFMIIAAISMFIALPLGYIYFKERSLQNKISNKQINPDTKQKWAPWKVNVGIILLAIIGHLTYSLESVIGSLGASFSVKSALHMDKKTGVLLATVFWSCFSFYRLIFIPLTFVTSEVKLLLMNTLFMIIGVLVCVPWANTYQICIWIGFTLLGVGISPIFSASYGMLSKHIVLTGKISPIIFIPGVLGESAHPALAATLMANNQISFLYYIGLLGVLLIITFATLMVYCKKVFKSPDGLHRGVKDRLSTLSISRH
ncbi:sodium-dependent glucose transporter 1 [Tetranychus urticae]|uniref:Major facilitator superfamily (MFS) profile domain-containing protein n=1 Tax=Tetranychus urticae TaxID=32264 RepID=T1KEQ0_TETUR|nr:sodium-dependent glucose transporter 1 [Tetranychus urticae]